MIGFIIREVAGWLLVLTGLYAFYLSYHLLTTESKLITAPPVALVGFFIFRGGIHLLKVSIAARVSYRAHREMTEAPRRPVRKK